MSTARVIIEDAPAPAAAPGAPDAAGNGHAPEARSAGDGALVCVAGTCGRAGATTVALLLSWHACQEGRRVLCCDAAGPAGDLARLAGARSARSLAQSAAILDRGRLDPDGLFATAPGGLRVIATDGEGLETAADGVGRLLSLARAAHDLTVVDAGTLAGPAAIAARQHASQLVWVLPATPEGRTRGQRTLDAVERHATARELIVARGCEPELGRVRPRELQQLAAGRHSPLILLPHINKLELPAGRETALEQCQPGLRELSRLTLGARAR